MVSCHTVSIVSCLLFNQTNFFKSTIWPICVESAVKSLPTNLGLTFFGLVHKDCNDWQFGLWRFCFCWAGGWRCLNGNFTIQTYFDESSPGLRQYAEEHRAWSPSGGDLNFARVFSSSEEEYCGITSFKQAVENAGTPYTFFLSSL